MSTFMFRASDVPNNSRHRLIIMKICFKLSPSKKPEERSQKNADQYARREREVKREILFLYKDVPGQPSEPGYPAGQEQHCSDQRDDSACYDQNLSEMLHARHSLFTWIFFLFSENVPSLKICSHSISVYRGRVLWKGPSIYAIPF